MSGGDSLKKEKKTEEMRDPYTKTETTDPAVPNRAHTEMTAKPDRETDIDDRHGVIPRIDF